MKRIRDLTYPTPGLVAYLELVEHCVLRRLSRLGIGHGAGRQEVDEDPALRRPVRALAPMRSRDNMRAVSEGIEAMGCEEAAYWLRMAIHRKNPCRVHTTPRCLLEESRRCRI